MGENDACYVMAYAKQSNICLYLSIQVTLGHSVG